MVDIRWVPPPQKGGVDISYRIVVKIQNTFVFCYRYFRVVVELILLCLFSLGGRVNENYIWPLIIE